MTVIHLTRPLDQHERLFLNAVRDHLRDLPKADRAELLAAAKANLADRPPTSDRWQLWAQLDPREYAADLRAEHGLGPERTDWYARWIARSRKGRYLGCLVVVVVLTAATIGVVEYRRWVDWQAPITLNGYSDLHVLGSPPLPMTETTAGGISQQTVTALPGRRGQFALILDPPPGVRITQMSFGLLPSSLADEVQVDTATVPTYISRPGVPDPPFEPLRYRSFRPFAATAGVTYVRFRFGFGHCAGWTAGSTEQWDSVTVHYRARGRDRVETVKLLKVLALAAPADKDCPTRHTG
jgi:hypothetical protein